MEASQLKELQMMEATNRFLDANVGVWSSVPIVATYKNQFSRIIDALKSSQKEEDVKPEPTDTVLQNLKITIAEKMDILDDVLEAYADDTKNGALLKQSENSKTDYIQLSDEAFEEKVQEVIALLEMHVNEMAAYGFNQDQIDDVKLSFNNYQDKLGKPRAYSDPLARPVHDTQSLLDEGLTSLEKLDGVIKRFKRSNNSFYQGYVEARELTNQ